VCVYIYIYNLVGNSEGNKLLGFPVRKGEDNIKTDLRVIGWGGMDCSHLAQDRD
jgi:hypothetical protein